MSTDVDAEPRHGRQVGPMVVLGAKLVVTGLCFWYIARNIALDDLLRAARTLDLRWAALAVVLVMLETPLAGLRWCKIVDALGGDRSRIPRAPMIAITAIGNFFTQVLPNFAADSIRVWMLAQLGRAWPQALASAVMDRVVGVGSLVAVGFVALLFPSALTALGGYRLAALEVFGGVLILTLGGLFLAPRIAAVLESWRYSVWLGKLVRVSHHVLLGSPGSMAILGLAFLVHGMTVVSVWLLGQALGLSLTAPDAAVLFTVMLGAALIPISIGGWGVREVAVTSLLANHDIPLEQALFFSVCFGLVLLVAMLPGGLVWAVYSPRKSRKVTAASGGLGLRNRIMLKT